MYRLTLALASFLGLGIGVATQGGCHGNCASAHCDCASSHCNCSHDHCNCADSHCAQAVELGAAWACNVLWIDAQDEVIAGDLLTYGTDADAVSVLERCHDDLAESDGPADAVDAACRCLPVSAAP